ELAALDIDARALELLVERAPPPLEQAQALARQVELALGAVELGQLLRFLALEPGRGLAVLAGEPPCLFQLLALGRLEAVLREGRRPEQEREGERWGAGRTEAHGPTARSTRESAISDAIQASATAAPRKASEPSGGRNTTPDTCALTACLNVSSTPSASTAASAASNMASITNGVAMKRSVAPSRLMISTCWRRARTVNRSVL